MLAGEEQHDEVRRRLHAVPVRLVGKLLDVAPQQPRMGLHGLGAGLLVGRLVGVEDPLQWGLRVDDDVLAAGQVDDHVRPQRLLVAGEARLLVEIAVPDHAGQLDDLAELHLTPLTARIGLAQRGDQRAGLGPQLLVGLGQLAHALGQHPLRLVALLVERKQLLIDPLQLIFQGPDQLFHCQLTLLELTLGLRLTAL